MKKNYRKIVLRGKLNPHGKYCYVMETGHYHRPIKTFNEIRQNVGALYDDDLIDHGVKPRSSRGQWKLNAWNDYSRSRNWKKSWKDFTKLDHQWQMKDEPDPRPYR